MSVVVDRLNGTMTSNPDEGEPQALSDDAPILEVLEKPSTRMRRVFREHGMETTVARMCELLPDITPQRIKQVFYAARATERKSQALGSPDGRLTRKKTTRRPYTKRRKLRGEETELADVFSSTELKKVAEVARGFGSIKRLRDMLDCILELRTVC